MKKTVRLTDMKYMKQFLFSVVLIIFLFFGNVAVRADQQAEGGEGLPPITLDDNYSDWQHIPDIATFTKQFNPYYFNKEVKGDMKSLPISESVFWGYNGTRIKEVRTLLSSSSFYFYISTFSPVTKGLIFFMYLHKGRESGTENEYTFEVSVNDIEGENDLLLWTFGNTKPVVVGKCRYDTNIMEGEVVFSLLPEQLGKSLVKFYSLDLTSCFFERAKGFYEEFFYTTIWFRDIPTETDL